jgi:alpha-L-rhamnosidase
VYGTGEQAYQALPLLLGITPPALRERVLTALEDSIVGKAQGHIDAGMHGTYFLLKTLMALDRNDLIYTMATQTTHPGWGYMLEQGATTLWESWEGSSHIHDTLISIGAWFIQGLGGIRVDEEAPGFARIEIRPAPVGDLTFVRARHGSPYGDIVSEWHITGGKLRLDVTIPPGATARVLVPGRDGRTTHEVGSGRHSFTTAWPR